VLAQLRIAESPVFNSAISAVFLSELGGKKAFYRQERKENPLSSLRTYLSLKERP